MFCFKRENEGYTQTRFLHTRGERYQFIKMSLSEDKFFGSAAIKDLFLLLHYFSINHKQSQLAQYIAKNISIPGGLQNLDHQLFHLKMVYGFTLEDPKWPNDPMNTVFRLLKLLDEKETTIFSYKLFASKESREQTHVEMKLILEITHTIFEAFFKPVQNKKTEKASDASNENNNNSSVTQKLTKSSIHDALEDFIVKKQIDYIPNDVLPIIEHLMPEEIKLKLKSSPSVPTEQSKLLNGTLRLEEETETSYQSQRKLN